MIQVLATPDDARNNAIKASLQKTQQQKDIIELKRSSEVRGIAAVQIHIHSIIILTIRLSENTSKIRQLCM